MPKDDYIFENDPGFAEDLDSKDPLRGFRTLFHLPGGAIYMLGNSLGLMPSASREAIERVTGEWRDLGIGGWLGADPPWFWLAEDIGAEAASLVGAGPDEVVCTGTTTFNIHSLVSTLYSPRKGKTKILASSSDFPTDIYALKSQVALRGFDWREELVLVGCSENGLVEEDRLIEAMDEEVALVLLPSVFYATGQLLDIERLASEAKKRGIIIGFDCSHSVGAVCHRFDDWGIDFAVWCSYKYMCGGPGAPAFIYLNRRHFELEPGLAGWFGYVKERQFDLNLDFEHRKAAGGWQVSSPGIIGAAGVQGALSVILDAGIDRIREKSKKMTSYMIFLCDQMLSAEPYGFKVLSPKEMERRGGHVALSRGSDVLKIKEALAERGVVADFRPPDIIRLSPSALYNSYTDIFRAMAHLRDIIDAGEHKVISGRRKPIT